MSTHVKPKIETRQAQPSVCIPVRATLQEWNNANAKIPVLFEWLGTNGVIPAGPLYFRYLVLGDMENPFELEIGIAVRESVDGSGDVVASEIPGGPYVTHVHHGHPDQIFRVDEEIAAWARDNHVEFDTRQDGDREVWTGRFQFFLTKPDEEPDPNKWATELAFRLKDGTKLPNGG